MLGCGKKVGTTRHYQTTKLHFQHVFSERITFKKPNCHRVDRSANHTQIDATFDITLGPWWTLVSWSCSLFNQKPTALASGLPPAICLTCRVRGKEDQLQCKEPQARRRKQHKSKTFVRASTVTTFSGTWQGSFFQNSKSSGNSNKTFMWQGCRKKYYPKLWPGLHHFPNTVLQHWPHHLHGDSISMLSWHVSVLLWLAARSLSQESSTCLRST